jgi:hypothetical protein
MSTPPHPWRGSFDAGPPMALRKAYSRAAGGHGVGRGKLGMKSQLRVKTISAKKQEGLSMTF